MSATMQLGSPASAPLHETRISQSPLEASREQESYALWKSVFERARPTRVATDGGLPFGADTLPGDTAAAARSHALAGRAASRAQLWSEPTAVRPVAPTHGITRFVPLEATASFAITPSAARPALPNTVQVLERLGAARTEEAAICSEAEVARSRERALLQGVQAAPSASQEAVVVSVRGTAVSIVVRDTAVSDEEALQCAFETARDLVGTRMALHQLTLNGRTLYRQDSAGGDSRPELCGLLFAC
jgi:hypothetical protein